MRFPVFPCVAAAALLPAFAPVLRAQVRLDSVPAAQSVAPESVAPAPHTIRWWEVGATAAGAALVAGLVDDPVQRWSQRNQSDGQSSAARVFRRMGQPEVYGVVAGGVIAAGLITGKPAVTRAGGRIATSLAVAAVVSQGLKRTAGRLRPLSGADADDFSLFSRNDAFPSGHTTMAFALAGAVSEELHNTWASVGLYTAAGLTGWSRVYNNKHWTSDVLVGAAVGIASAKVVSGRWKVFGLRPPQFLVTPRGAGFGWSAKF